MDLEVKAFTSGKPISVEPDQSAMAAVDVIIDHGIRHRIVDDETNGAKLGYGRSLDQRFSSRASHTREPEASA